MNTIANFLEWILENISVKAIIICIIAIYILACIIDLTAPIDTSRGSWWNIFYQILNGICCN